MGWQDGTPIEETPAWQQGAPIEPQLTKTEQAAKGLRNLFAGQELALAAGTAAVAEPVGGIMSLYASSSGDGGMGRADVAENVRSAMTYQPRSELAQAGQEFLGSTIGKYGEAADWVGEKAMDITGSPAVGAGVKTGMMMLPAVIPGVGPALRAVRRAPVPRPPPIQLAQEAGYILEPMQSIAGKQVGGRTKRAAAAVGGKAVIPARASIANQKITNRLVAEEIGAPNPVMITKAEIAQLRQTANNSYTKIKANTTKLKVDRDATYQQAIDDAIEQASDAFTGQGPPPGVLKKLEALKNPQGQQSIGAAMNSVEKLRREARTLFKSDDPAKIALAKANKQAATAIEDAVGRVLETGAPELLAEYQAARTQLAKLHTVEDAWVSGDINAVKLAKMRERGDLMTGNFELIADVADYFPRAMQTRPNLGSIAGSGKLDTFATFATLGMYPGVQAAAQKVAMTRPPYRPAPYVSPLASGEAIGSQISRYEEGR